MSHKVNHKGIIAPQSRMVCYGVNDREVNVKTVDVNANRL